MPPPHEKSPPKRRAAGQAKGRAAPPPRASESGGLAAWALGFLCAAGAGGATFAWSTGCQHEEPAPEPKVAHSLAAPAARTDAGAPRVDAGVVASSAPLPE